MATIEHYSLAGGQRRYRVRFRTPDRRTTEKSGFTTKKAAQDWAATVEVSKNMGTFVSPSAGRVTVVRTLLRHRQPSRAMPSMSVLERSPKAG